MVLICSLSLVLLTIHAYSADEVEASNREALDLLQKEIQEIRDPPPNWVIMVPGYSEQWGHHRAPPISEDEDGTRISEEFKKRLDIAAALYGQGLVRFIVVSGGAVDLRRPDYVEATRGIRYLVGKMESRYPQIKNRIITDLNALETAENIYQTNQLLQGLNIGGYLIASPMPDKNRFAHSLLPGLGQYNHWWYLRHHQVSTFDCRCRKKYGQTLGDFIPISFRLSDQKKITILRYSPKETRPSYLVRPASNQRDWR
jgi:hypothetical protein